MSPLSIILLSPVKKMKSREKYAQVKHRLQAKTVQICRFYVRGQQWIDFFTVRSLNMNMDWYFSQKQWFIVKKHLDMFLTNMLLFTSQAVEWCGLL